MTTLTTHSPPFHKTVDKFPKKLRKIPSKNSKKNKKNDGEMKSDPPFGFDHKPTGVIKPAIGIELTLPKDTQIKKGRLLQFKKDDTE